MPRPSREQRRVLQSIRMEWNDLVDEASRYGFPCHRLENTHSTQTRRDGTVETGIQIGARRLLELRKKVNRRRSGVYLPRSRALDAARMWLTGNQLREVETHLGLALVSNEPLYLRPALRQWDRGIPVPPAPTPTPIPAPLPVLIPHHQQKFGVEFEFLLGKRVTPDVLVSALVTQGINVKNEGYTHRVREHWKLVTDSSLGDIARGYELVSPPMKIRPESYAEIEKVVNVTRGLGCVVSPKCGLHTHVGAKDRNPLFLKRLVEFYAKFEPTIDTIIGHSRREREYCKPLVSVATNLGSRITPMQIADALGQTPDADHQRGNAGRYFKLNVQAYFRYGTVEFRHHQGTLMAKKALNWIKLCLAMAEWADRTANTYVPTLTGLEEPAVALQTMLTVLRMGQDEVAYFEERRQMLSSGEE